MPNRSRLARMRLLRRLRNRKNGQDFSRDESAAPAENETLAADSSTDENVEAPPLAANAETSPDENTARTRAAANAATALDEIETASADDAASTRKQPRRRWTRLARSRAVRWIAPLTLFAILALWVAGVVRQRVDIDAIVRHSVLPEIEKRVGAPVEVGRIESDLSHVTLTDVVIGRDAKLPTGALLRAKTIRLDADLVAIALRRVSDPLAALRSVTVTAPQLYLRRDARGVFNWAKVFQTPSQGAAASWNGNVKITDGRVYFLDETLRAAPQSRIAGAPLRVDARGIDGSAEFAKDGKVAFSAALASTRFPLYGKQISALKISGESGTTPAAAGQNAARWLTADANFSALPAFVFTDYAFRGGQIVTRAGTLAGKLQVAFDAAAPPVSRLLFAGELRLSGIEGRSELVKLPDANSLQFAALSGPLVFRGTAFSSTGIAVRTLGTPLRLAGSFALPTAEKPAPQTIASTRAASKNDSRKARVVSNRARATTAPNALKTPNENFGSASSSAKNSARDSQKIARRDALATSQNGTANSQDASTRAPSRLAAEAREAKNAPQKRPVISPENAAALSANATARLKAASTRALKNAARTVRKNRDDREMRAVSTLQKSSSKPTIFDISARSNDVEMARVLPLLRAFPALRGVQIEAARGALQLQISGDTTAFSTAARLQLPAFSLRDARFGALRGSSLFADLNVNRNGRGALALKTSQAVFASDKTFGAVRAPRGSADLLHASLNFGADAAPALRFDVSAWRGQALSTTSNAVFRAAEKLQLRASASRGFATFATNGTLRGGALTISQARISSPRARVLATDFVGEFAPSGQAANAQSYALNISAKHFATSGAILPNAKGGASDAALNARDLRVAATLGRENSATFSSGNFAARGFGANGFRAAGSALRGAARQSGRGYFSVDFTSPALRLTTGNSSALPEALRDLKLNGAAWNGAARVANAPNSTRVARGVFYASTRRANLQSARFGSLRAAALEVHFLQNGVSQRAALQLKSFAAKPGTAWPQQARRVLGNQSLRGTSARIDAFRKGAASAWNGVLSLQKIDASSLDLKAMSAQLGNSARDLGTLSGRANFSLGARSVALSNGEFALSRIVVEGEELRDVRGFASLQNGALQLRELRAQTDSGVLSAQADYDFSSGALALQLNAPRLALDVARLNPYLAAQGISLGGRVVGKISVNSASGAKSGAPLRVEFDVTVPRGVVRSLASTRKTSMTTRFAATSARDMLAIKNLRLRGSGIWRSAARGWNFSGESELFAERTALSEGTLHLARMALPNWAGGARARNFHAKMRGEISGTTNGKNTPLLLVRRAQTPTLSSTSPRDFPVPIAAARRAESGAISPLRARLSGSIFAEKISAPLPRKSASTRAGNIEIADARADFSWDDALRVPRFAARAPQLAARLATFSAASQRTGAALSQNTSAANAGRIGGSFSRRADGTIGGQIALDAFEARAVQNLAAQISPTFSTRGAQIVRGAAFARVALSGTLATPRARLQMQLLDAGVRTATAGVPIDLLRLQTTLPPRANGALSIDEATLWSGGGRLSLSGEIKRIREYSQGLETFALNLQARADGLPMARLAATPQLQKLRRELELDGLVSGDASIRGTLSQPRVEGRAALRLAQIAGVGVAEITSPLLYEMTPRGAVLKLASLTARIEQAAVSGAVTVDAPAGVWNADLKIDGAPTSRLLRAAAEAADLLARREKAAPLSITASSTAPPNSDFARVAEQLRALQDAPLRADLRAELSLRGTAGIEKIASATRQVSAPHEYSQLEKSGARLETHELGSDVANVAKIALQNSDDRDATVARKATGNRADVALQNPAKSFVKKIEVSPLTASAEIRHNAAQRDSDGAESNRAATKRNRVGRKILGEKSAQMPPREYSQSLSQNAWWPVLTLESASLKLASDDVKWRGRTLGELRATLLLQEKIARANVTLVREKSLAPSARQYAPAPFLDAAFTEKLTAQNDGQARDVILKISGEVPLRRGEKLAAAPLDVTAQIDDEKFSLVRDALNEAQNALRERGFRYANFDAAMLRLRTLPRELQADVSVQARLSGTLETPALALDVVADNARRGAQTLPSLQGAFDFDDGTIGVRGLELRQPYEDKTREYSRLVSGAARSVATEEKAASKTEAPNRTTVIRLAEGGRIAPTGDIELDGEILNANLSQLAAWIPELRQENGAPLLRGEVSLFTFQVRGTMEAPRVAGSVEARDLLYRAYTLDRLRVSRFDIADGRFSIAPGNFTVVKGKFQSSAPWGFVPWTWGDETAAPGPQRNAMLEVHFPLQTRDFGALAGTFVPALQNAEAEDFSGTITLTGSLDAPQISGEATLQNARFRADPALLPLDFGIEGLTGKVRFEDGNRLKIDDVRGRLVEADKVRAAATNNLPAAQRDARAARRAARRPDAQKPPHLAGAFSLDGSVQLDLDARNFEAPGQSLSAHRYDVKLSLQNGEYSTAQFSGLRNIALDLALQTAAGAPRTSQNLFWTLNANGVSSDRKGRKSKPSAARDGLLVSSAAVVLAPDFASSANAFFRSRFRGRVLMRALPFAVKNVAMGQLDGLLQLDNEAPSAGRRPFALPPTLAALQRELKPARATKTLTQTVPSLSLETRASGLQQPLSLSSIVAKSNVISPTNEISSRDFSPLPTPRNAPASTRNDALKIIADDPRRLSMRGASNRAPATFSTQRDNARAGARNGIEARANESVADAALSPDFTHSATRDSQENASPIFDASPIFNASQNAGEKEIGKENIGDNSLQQTPPLKERAGIESTLKGAAPRAQAAPRFQAAPRVQPDLSGLQLPARSFRGGASATKKSSEADEGIAASTRVGKANTDRASVSAASSRAENVTLANAPRTPQIFPNLAEQIAPSQGARATSAVPQTESAPPQNETLFSQAKPGAKSIREQLAPREYSQDENASASRTAAAPNVARDTGKSASQSRENAREYSQGRDATKNAASPNVARDAQKIAPKNGEIAPRLNDENAREYSQGKDAAKTDAAPNSGRDAEKAESQSGEVAAGNNGAAGGKVGAENQVAVENSVEIENKIGVRKAPISVEPISTEVARRAQQIAQSVTANQTKSREKSRALQEKLARETATQLAAAASPLKVTPPNELRALSESDFGAPLRVSGQVEMSQTEMTGVPVGEAGIGGVLPDAPRFDVALLIGRDVRFVTPTLRAQFSGALEVGGTPHDPYIVGTLSTRDGLIRFPNASARLTEGEVTVNITRDPVADAIRSRVEIDAAATGRAGSYNITLAVRGPLDFGSDDEQNLRVDVSSDPPLAKDEAFALLTGTSLRDLEQNGPVRAEDANRLYARAVVGLLASPIFAGIERTLEEALGLNSITLDYRFEEPLSVQFGKAIGDRVYVTYRRSVGPAFNNARTPYNLRVEYRIKGGLQLGVQTDETGRNQVTLNKTFRFW